MIQVMLDNLFPILILFGIILISLDYYARCIKVNKDTADNIIDAYVWLTYERKRNGKV